MISMSTPFSASTMRVRWLWGSSGAENSVMMERRDTDQPSSVIDVDLDYPAPVQCARCELQARPQCTAFQYSRFNIHAKPVSTSRYRTTQMPIERRSTCAGSEA